MQFLLKFVLDKIKHNLQVHLSIYSHYHLTRFKIFINNRDVRKKNSSIQLTFKYY